MSSGAANVIGVTGEGASAPQAVTCAAKPA